MPDESTLEHLTAFEDNDHLDELQDRTPEDRLDFRLLYDPDVVSPWSENPNDVTRLYFNADRLDGFYVPIHYPERLEDGMRSTPIGRPTTDDDGERSWDEADGGDYRIEEGAEIDGHEFDVLWYSETDDGEEVLAVAAELDGASA